MHAFDLLLDILAPLRFVRFDHVPAVRRVYGAVIEQITQSNGLDISSYTDWASANSEALFLLAEFYGVRYADLSLPEYMTREEHTALFLRIVDHFVETIEDKLTLKKTCNKVWKLTQLSPRQLDNESSKYSAAKHIGKEYEVSNDALSELKWLEEQKGEGKKWRKMGKLVKKLVMVGL